MRADANRVTSTAADSDMNVHADVASARRRSAAVSSAMNSTVVTPLNALAIGARVTRAGESR